MLPRLLVAPLAAMLLAGAPASAGSTFRLEVGPPAAANAPGIKKNTAFAVRALACATPAKAGFAAVAHAVVNGTRVSAPLDLAALGTPGAYAVPYPPQWPKGTSGVVILSGTCDTARAGAVVTLGPNGFARESTKLLDRAPAETDVNEALAALRPTATR